MEETTPNTAKINMHPQQKYTTIIIAPLDYREDARVLLSGATYTISVPIMSY